MRLVPSLPPESIEEFDQIRQAFIQTILGDQKHQEDNDLPLQSRTKAPRKLMTSLFSQKHQEDDDLPLQSRRKAT